MRTSKLLVFLCWSAGFALVGGSCGDDESDQSGVHTDAAAGAGGTGGASNTGGTGGTGGGSNTGGTGGGGTRINICPSATNSTCKQSEVDDYNSCLIGRCEKEYKTCFGDAFKTGSFGGPCGPWLQCTNKCSCSESACRAACGFPNDACLTCLAGPAQTCQYSSGCARPACYGN